MELSEILTLVKAGYTKDEISQMDKQPTVQPDTEPVPVAANEQEAKPVPEPVVTPVADAEPVPVAQPVQQEVSAQKENQPSMDDVMQSIAKLTSAIQANAIAQSVIPQGLQNPPKAEDMLAEIIRPTFKERG